MTECPNESPYRPLRALGLTRGTSPSAFSSRLPSRSSRLRGSSVFLAWQRRGFEPNDGLELLGLLAHRPPSTFSGANPLLRRERCGKKIPQSSQSAHPVILVSFRLSRIAK
jgi:hypothetical protein